ncbi:hypothetical protein PCANB_001994 [Pneumocystis canis]|nr:hypothetical protein PCK1_001739 [Pneumocystis canis]KAG5439420.1 hypothetical protein PCANB_001994 [Pneumocystis canis]
MIFAFWILFLSTITFIKAEVLELTSKTFFNTVGGKKPVFVKFYAPWCGHCQKLEPIYSKIGEMYNQENVIIARINADEYRDIAEKYNIRGFPTLIWFDSNSDIANPYNDNRDIDSLSQFIQNRFEASLEGKSKKPSAIELTPDNFYKIVMDPEKDVLVKFYAPWCRHCKALEPIYTNVYTCFLPEKHVVIAKMNADEHQSFALEYDIQGYPTIKFFPKGSLEKIPVDYNGKNTEEDIISFINTRANTMRVPGGDLNNMAGRIKEFDSIVKGINPSNAKNILSKLKNIAGKSEDRYTLYYIKLAEKVISSPEFIETEYRRLEKLLKNILERPKSDDIKMRKNILSVFRFKEKQLSDEL